MWIRQFICLVVVTVFGGLVAAGCAAEAPNTANEGMAPMDGAPATAEVVETPPMPTTVAELFPEGAGKALVLENCSACHAVACSAMGQRTNGRWDSLKEDHRDKASGLPEEDLDTLFAYLKDNFNESMPEPMIPAHFLEGGCTPF